MSTNPHSVRVFAPAKLNLYLHVLKRLPNGQHALDSLVTFADVGDNVMIESAQGFTFEITGPFAHKFSDDEKSSSPTSKNLAVKAVWALSKLCNRAPALKLTLEKNLPFGAGLGGGSADAGAVIFGLLKLWDIKDHPHGLDNMLLSLGADIPACFYSRDLQIKNIGDVHTDIPKIPELPIVMIYPGKPCNTKTIFQNFNASFKEAKKIPASDNIQDFLRFLDTTENSLTPAAIKTVPAIENALHALHNEEGCLLKRMSGSGAACFGIFDHEENAQKSAKQLSEQQ